MPGLRDQRFEVSVGRRFRALESAGLLVNRLAALGGLLPGISSLFDGASLGARDGACTDIIGDPPKARAGLFAGRLKVGRKGPDHELAGAGDLNLEAVEVGLGKGRQAQAGQTVDPGQKAVQRAHRPVDQGLDSVQRGVDAHGHSGAESRRERLPVVDDRAIGADERPDDGRDLIDAVLRELVEPAIPAAFQMVDAIADGAGRQILGHHLQRRPEGVAQGDGAALDAGELFLGQRQAVGDVVGIALRKLAVQHGEARRDCACQQDQRSHGR